MITELSEILLCLFFLAGLALVSRLRPWACEISTKSYRLFSGGVSVLSLSALLGFYSGSGLLASIPMLMDPLFARLIVWAGMITGMILLINGVTMWAPLVRRARPAIELSRSPHRLIEMTEQLIRADARIPVVLTRTLQNMVDELEVSMGVAYTYSHRRKQLELVGTGFSSEDCRVPMREMTFDKEVLRQFAERPDRNVPHLIMRLPSGVSQRPTISLPILVGDSLAGVIFLWGEADALVTAQDRTDLQLAVEIIERQIHSDYRRIETGIHREVTELQRLVMNDLDGTDIEQSVVRLWRRLNETIACSAATLTLFRYGDTSRRLTVGANGALLDERRVAFTSLTEWARRRWPFGLTAGVHTLSGMTGGVSAADVGLPGMSSTVIIPILDGKTVLGLYGVGTDLAPRFDKRAMMMLEGVWPCLSAFALSALSADGWPRRSSRSIMTKRLAGMIANGVSQDEVFKTAAAILQSELRASIVRVSTFDSDGAFLTSRALSCRNAFVANTPERGHMILSLMSVHREAGDSGVPILFDQRSESLKLSEAEATHSLNDEVGHGVLVPMIHSGRTVGVISIGRQQSSHERAIGEDDLMFAESVAELLGQTFPSRRWSDPGRSDRALQSPSTQPATDSDYGNLRTTVRTSLASILGSLEAIRLEGDTEIDRLSQHLAVIDRSARYLDDCIRQVEIDTVVGGDQGG